MLQQEAMANLLHEKGIISKDELLEYVKRLKEKYKVVC